MTVQQSTQTRIAGITTVAIHNHTVRGYPAHLSNTMHMRRNAIRGEVDRRRRVWPSGGHGAENELLHAHSIISVATAQHQLQREIGKMGSRKQGQTSSSDGRQACIQHRHACCSC